MVDALLAERAGGHGARSRPSIAVTLHTSLYWHDEDIKLDMGCRRRARVCVERLVLTDIRYGR